MTTGPQSIPEPQRVLLLKQAGKSTRQIARELHLSQSTVVRRLREAATEDALLRRRQFWAAVMFVLLTCSAVVLTAAVATLAWR
jgi:orotate phosphoribosyltransferase-like protein